MNAIFFILFTCGQPTHFLAATADAYAVEPISAIHAEGEYADALRTAFMEAKDNKRILRIDLEDLTGSVCI